MTTTIARSATSKQVAFIVRLLAERDTAGTPLAALTPEVAATMGSVQASNAITALMALPRREAAVPAAPLPEPGTFWEIDGTVWAVKKARSTGNAYAMRLVGREWLYEGARGLRTIARDGARLTAQLAANVGRENNRCVFCWLPLSDDRSIATGYGPVCAAKHGLAWGDDALAPAHSCEDFDGECCSPTGMARVR